MKKQAIEETIEKAEAFLTAARDLVSSEIDMKGSERGTGSARSGALRRASMELTRSLTVMRTWDGKRPSRWGDE